MMGGKHTPERRKHNRRIARLLITGIFIQITLLVYVFWQHGDAVDQIQEQRFETLYQGCLETNQRHNNAVDRANKLLPSEREQLVVILVGELQPHRDDCVAYANSRVKGIK